MISYKQLSEMADLGASTDRILNYDKLKTLQPVAQFYAKIYIENLLSLADSKGLQFDAIVITSTKRTKEEQQKLYDEGKTKVLDSYHVKGLAFDVVFLQGGFGVENPEIYDLVYSDALQQTNEELQIKAESVNEGNHIHVEIIESVPADRQLHYEKVNVTGWIVDALLVFGAYQLEKRRILPKWSSCAVFGLTSGRKIIKKVWRDIWG